MDRGLDVSQSLYGSEVKLKNHSLSGNQLVLPLPSYLHNCNVLIPNICMDKPTRTRADDRFHVFRFELGRSAWKVGGGGQDIGKESLGIQSQAIKLM